ncbi:MAG: 30S ribosomal protein S7 [Candidatus Levybacteria bacterium]|nr:30S ribosomal protein S7 [Candidatus Levybacteria bacterium]
MRHAKITKREVEPDKIHNSILITKFINKIMKDGKKTTAEKRVYGMFKLLSEKNENPVEIFEKALQNVGPKVEVKSRRVGGANYQVPQEVRHERRTTLAIRWILEAAKKRSNKEYRSFEAKLAAELNDAANNAGEAIRKRDVVLKQAEANRAFSHFRW